MEAGSGRSNQGRPRGGWSFAMNKAERVYAEIGKIPQIARGRVWCHRCGNTMQVNGVGCVRHGWPRCCGETMSIDSPEERAAHRARAGGGVTCS